MEGTNVSERNNKREYALLPVWLLHVKWQNKLYTFAMNGQTGKFVGDLPSDKGKAWGIFFAVTVAVTILSYLIGTLIK